MSLYFMVGIARSGKSTIANQLKFINNLREQVRHE